jgi:uncharacterized coiled-coil protein SlyX
MAVSETDMRIEDLQKRMTLLEERLKALTNRAGNIDQLLRDAHIGSG